MAKNTTSAPTLNRRSFVAAGVAASACLASGCAPEAKVGTGKEASYAQQGAYEGGLANTSLNDGEWKFMECNKGCGGGCVNMALVKDGKVVRTKTDSSHEDSLEHPQFRGCLRGRCAAELDFGPDRLTYPVKRKHWSPDDPHGELRGQDEWERISWDEALDIVADQLKKVYTTYGPRAVFYPWDQRNDRTPVLDACGGYIASWDTQSFGSYLMDLAQLGLPEVAYGGLGTVNDRFDIIENAQTIVLYAQDPAWSAIAFAAWNLRAAKDKGAHFVCVGPFYNASANAFDADWVPVFPGTDTAFMLGVIFEMLRLDEEEGGIIDWDFLHKYCIGFDDESMPQDATLNENIKGYVLGQYDGIPKTASWASAICGTPESTITEFARTVGKQDNVVMSHGYAAARCSGSEDIPQLFLTIACMGGHMGKPGNCYGPLWVDGSGCGGPALVKLGKGGDGWDVSSCVPLCSPDEKVVVRETGSSIIRTAADDNVNGLELYNAVLDGRYSNVGICWGGQWRPIEERECDIHLIWGEFSSALRAGADILRGIEAFKKVDFVVMRDHVPKMDCVYADIVLPLAGRQQQESLGTRREEVCYYSVVANPDDEAKPNRWVNEQLLERLGYDPAQVYPVSPQQALYNQMAGATVMNEKGEYETLFTITQSDIDEMGVEGAPQEGKIGLSEFKEKGIYTVERKAGDAFTHIGLADFFADPDANPLPSASGKFELYCQAKAETFNMISFDGRAFKPYPIYSEQTKPEAYRFRCFSPHYPRSAGSTYSNVLTLREAWPAPLLLNSKDAENLGISDGDVAHISSAAGSILRKVCVTSLIMEGTVGLPNGCWPKIDEEGIDRGGCGSTLIGGKPSGMGVTGHNNVWVNIEKWEDNELDEDCEWQSVIQASA